MIVHIDIIKEDPSMKRTSRRTLLSTPTDEILLRQQSGPGVLLDGRRRNEPRLLHDVHESGGHT